MYSVFLMIQTGFLLKILWESNVSFRTVICRSKAVAGVSRHINGKKVWIVLDIIS